MPIAFLAFIGIVYGALVAMAQRDFKKLIAYSSVNHMGYVMLGLAAAAYRRHHRGLDSPDQAATATRRRRRYQRGGVCRCSPTASSPARCSSWSA